MSDSMIEPQSVIQLVESYISSELHDAEKYTNRKPFDQSGVWSLHQLARDIYALGVQDGVRQEQHRENGQRQRASERAEK